MAIDPEESSLLDRGGSPENITLETSYDSDEVIGRRQPLAVAKR